MNGGQGRRGLHPAWAVNLTMYQWPLVYGRTQDLLRLQSVRLVVPQDEYTALLGAHGAPASSTAARLGGVTWVGLGWGEGVSVQCRSLIACHSCRVYPITHLFGPMSQLDS